MNDFFNVTLRPNSNSFDAFGEVTEKRHWNEVANKYLPKFVGGFPHQLPSMSTNYDTNLNLMAPFYGIEG